MSNEMLNHAKSNAKDEFYTQLLDIEKELIYYKNCFVGKIIYCNCDNPKYSNFWRYFHEHFTELGLKCLRATYYDVSHKVYLYEYFGENDADLSCCNAIALDGDGNFSFKACIAVLRQSDVIVTNPSFSLFREYLDLLMRYHKLFLIVGNMNAVTYKDVFPLFKDHKMWYGISIHSGDRELSVPDDYNLYASGCYVGADHQKYIRVKGVRWFTNLACSQMCAALELHCSYRENPDKYLRYDEFDAININAVKDIPYDYDGVIGVLISFLDKWRPDQFELLNCNDYRKNGLKSKSLDMVARPHINGKTIYRRIFIKRIG